MSDEEWHPCHFCGAYVNKEGYENKHERHFLSDCRPDLIEHEIGSVCTWSHRRLPHVRADGSILEPLPENTTCYAYQNLDGLWTDKHKHFYPDGPL